MLHENIRSKISGFTDEIKQSLSNPSITSTIMKLDGYQGCEPQIKAELSDFSVKLIGSIPGLLVLPFQCHFELQPAKGKTIKQIMPPLSFGDIDSEAINNGHFDMIDAYRIRTELGLIAIEVLKAMDASGVEEILNKRVYSIDF